MPWFLTPVVGTCFAEGVLPRCQLKHQILLEKEDIQVKMHTSCCVADVCLPVAYAYLCQAEKYVGQHEPAQLVQAKG